MKDTRRYFTEGDIQAVAYKHMETCSMSLAIRAMHIQPTMTYHHICTWMAKILNNQQNPHIDSWPMGWSHHERKAQVETSGALPFYRSVSPKKYHILRRQWQKLVQRLETCREGHSYHIPHLTVWLAQQLMVLVNVAVLKQGLQNSLTLLSLRGGVDATNSRCDSVMPYLLQHLLLEPWATKCGVWLLWGHQAIRKSKLLEAMYNRCSCSSKAWPSNWIPTITGIIKCLFNETTFGDGLLFRWQITLRNSDRTRWNVFSPLHNVCGLCWDDSRAGGDQMAGGYTLLEASSLTCLLPVLGCLSWLFHMSGYFISHCLSMSGLLHLAWFLFFFFF